MRSPPDNPRSLKLKGRSSRSPFETTLCQTSDRSKFPTDTVCHSL
ncbi:hypothetical protein CKA32_004048 [Geitlerinema sp. FC II]|nr:hypothetical protein CKA32_004048 [Geitlerinema sp. FC II]